VRRDPHVSWLLAELLVASRNARRPDVRPTLVACGLELCGPICGVDFVEADASHYAPAPGGKAAIIVPHFEGGRLLDLVACSLDSRAMRSRTGICTVLGEDRIDAARWEGSSVRLFRDALEWLCAGRDGAVLVDMRAARHVLADLPAVIANDALHAKAIERAMRHPTALPRVSAAASTRRRAA
jgi:hypothetical protein